VRLGELVVAAFDEAATRSTDPREVSRLATQTVIDLVQLTSPGSSRASRRAATAGCRCLVCVPEGRELTLVREPSPRGEASCR
jgi:hypothetical protein